MSLTKITGDTIALGTVVGANIAGGTVTGSHIANATVTGSNIANATITEPKLGAEFTTSIALPTVTGSLEDLYLGQTIFVDAYYGTQNGSGIELRFAQLYTDPNIAFNQLAGATVTFDGPEGSTIGSIPMGSYTIGSNSFSFMGIQGEFMVLINLDPEIQTDTTGGQVFGPLATLQQATATPTVDFSSAQVFTRTLNANENIVFTNYTTGAVKDLLITGDYTLGFTTGTVNIAAGEYDGSINPVPNLIQVLCVDDVAPTFWVTISQPQI